MYAIEVLCLFDLLNLLVHCCQGQIFEFCYSRFSSVTSIASDDFVLDKEIAFKPIIAFSSFTVGNLISALQEITVGEIKTL